jgi:hypothetical protein
MLILLHSPIVINLLVLSFLLILLIPIMLFAPLTTLPPHPDRSTYSDILSTCLDCSFPHTYYSVHNGHSLTFKGQGHEIITGKKWYGLMGLCKERGQQIFLKKYIVH